MPVIGFLSSQSLDANSSQMRVFRQGHKDSGYVEGENVTFGPSCRLDRAYRTHDLECE